MKQSSILQSYLTPLKFLPLQMVLRKILWRHKMKKIHNFPCLVTKIDTIVDEARSNDNNLT